MGIHIFLLIAKLLHVGFISHVMLDHNMKIFKMDKVVKGKCGNQEIKLRGET